MKLFRTVSTGHHTFIKSEDCEKEFGCKTLEVGH